ncbi:hypothetical protein GGR54DRAFT_503235 [Hypoxylon sp. NC1633]|nr:hypothetical protein GGR54DRAFT_503235 [Hypoxylon sp. NC1633]
MNTMDLDVEMDVDVDLVPDEPILPEPEPQEANGNRSPGEIDDTADDQYALVPNKVHIRGLDTMNPDQVRAYIAEHFPEDPVDRIEWIDDSSANILFGSGSTAARALRSLAIDDIPDVSQLPILRSFFAKPFSEKPDVSLQIRLAVAADKKQVGAASRSRFYLLNPEYDPEERRRRTESRRFRERDGDGHNRRRTGGIQTQEAEEQFDVSLYDDDPNTSSGHALQSWHARRRSLTPDASKDRRRWNSYRNDNRGKELFPDGLSSRAVSQRERSASPIRDRRGDRDEDENPSAQDRDGARTRRSRLCRSNQSRELFPDDSDAGVGRLGDRVEDTATLLAKGIMLPLMDKSSDVLEAGERRPADRIPAPDRRASDSVVSGFNIRGTASQTSTDQGFAIKGSAGKSAKELFPEKLGINAGKELFADRLEGRSKQRRQRAGDLFD